MKIIAATTNMNKVREIREILDKILSASGKEKYNGIPGDNCDTGTACDKCNANISLNKIEVISMAEAGINADIAETGATFEENAAQKARAVLDLLAGARSNSNFKADSDCSADLPREIGETEKPYDKTDFTEEEKFAATTDDFKKIIVIANDSGLGDEKIIVIADDSGLEIDFLGGAPGIHSARFMGHDTSYDFKCAAILDKMKDVPDKERTARFVCAMAVAEASVNDELHAENPYSDAADGDTCPTALYPAGSDPSKDTKKIAAEFNPHNKCKAETTSSKNSNIIIFRGVMEGRIAHKPAGRNGFGYDPIFYLPEFGCTSAELSPDEKNSVSHRGKALRTALQYISSLHSN